MLHDYRKPYKNRRIEPLGQWLVTPLEHARQTEKDLRATSLGVARRDGKPVRLWSFNLHNTKGEIREFVEYHETQITGDETDEIISVMDRGRDLQRRLGLEQAPWSDDEAAALRKEGWENDWPVSSTWTRVFDDPRVSECIGYLDFFDYGVPDAKRIQFAYKHPNRDRGGSSQDRDEADNLAAALASISRLVKADNRTARRQSH
ncbi:hypothetical protein IPU75_08470 [Ochrobactrum sp. SD129]|nr:hypothetical protein [Ochrobactrum sp. SD129]